MFYDVRINRTDLRPGGAFPLTGRTHWTTLLQSNLLSRLRSQYGACTTKCSFNSHDHGRAGLPVAVLRATLILSLSSGIMLGVEGWGVGVSPMLYY